MKIIYHIGNPFNIDKKYALINLLSADYFFRNNNIHKNFTMLYNSKEYIELIYKDFKNQSGKCLKQKHEDRIIFHLTVKTNYWEKSNIEYFISSLQELKKEDIKYICIPRKNNYIEDFDWKEVENNIEKIFKDTDITIMYCSL